MEIWNRGVCYLLADKVVVNPGVDRDLMLGTVDASPGMIS
jgi:hypothetical protein